MTHSSRTLRVSGHAQQMRFGFVSPLAGGHDAAHDRVLAQHAMMLGQTMDRMEETFNFQVRARARARLGLGLG